MAAQVLSLFLLTLLAAQVTPQVHSLTPDTLTEFLENHNFVFLKVFSATCGHCKSAEAPFKAVSKRYQDQKIVFAEVDGDKHPAIMERLGISAFPGIFFFARGFANRLQYLGPVSEEKYFVEFLDELAGRLYPKVYTRALAGALEKSEAYIGFGIFCGAQDWSTFQKLQTSIVMCHEVVYFTTEDEGVCVQFNLAKGGFGYQRVSGNVDTLEDMFQPANLRRHLLFMKYDWVNPCKKEFFVDAIEEKLPMFVLVSHQSSGAAWDAFAAFARELPPLTALAMHNQLRNEFEKEYFQLFGVKETDLPILMALEMGQPMKKTRYQGAWDRRELRTFFDRYMAQRSSRPLSDREAKDAAAVLHLQRENMLPFLTDKTTSKLLLIYSDDCEGCQELQRVFVQVGTQLLREKTPIKLGKVNVSEGEIPNIGQVPSIVLFRTTFQTSPEVFKGAANRDNILGFVHQKLEGDSDL